MEKSTQKQVKIIGLELREDLGILKAHKVEFNQDNNLIAIKGKVGAGKSTLQTALKLGTQGSKTLKDNTLYGKIDSEIQLLDGDLNIWIGCKSNDKGMLAYSLYTKDDAGKIIKKPVIDGIEATPAKYLEALQTKLTWRLDELTSESQSVQKKILLDLYKHKLIESGIILDKGSEKYKESILGKIDIALKERDYRDMLRKEKGGIADDLKAKGFNPEKPEQIPDEIDLKEFDSKIAKLRGKIENIKDSAQQKKKDKLQGLKDKISDLTLKVHEYNSELKEDYNKAVKKYNKKDVKKDIIKGIESTIAAKLQDLAVEGGITQKTADKLRYKLSEKIVHPEPGEKPTEPIFIKTNDKGKIADDNKQLPHISEFLELKNKYINIQEKEIDTDAETEELKSEINLIKEKREEAEKNNEIVLAVDAWHTWRQADQKVKDLKNKYVQMLAGIKTGVKGLKIVADKTGNIYLTYNGQFNPEYFNNPEKEDRKLSSYSGTQKPIIALLVQNYLLSRKEKALRYLYIDNIPIDSQTRNLIESMAEKLDITIIMNITGDFSADNLQDGEIFIENGELFFN
jgi:hypothetical protein